jgi:hypothetical protein
LAKHVTPNRPIAKFTKRILALTATAALSITGIVALNTPAALATGCDATLTSIPSSPSTAGFGGGTGSVADPWLICSRAQLEGLDDNAATLAGNYELASNIDLGGVADDPSTHWEPLIGTQFSGTLDGNYFSISNMYISGDRLRFGLFSVLAGGTVKKLAIADSTIVSASTVVDGETTDIISVGGSIPAGGLMAGSARNATLSEILISSSNVGGILQQAGLLVGENMVSNSSLNASLIKISNSSVTSSATWASSLAGVGGVLGGGQIILHRASVESSVTITQRTTGSQWVGGLVGTTRGNSRPTITQSQSSAQMTGRSTGYLGGLVGADGGDSISNSAFDGTITLASNPLGIGGAQGFSTVPPTNFLGLSAIPSNVAAFGPINGSNISAATAAPTALYDRALNGGFNTANEFGTPKTTAELKQIATYSDPSWKIAATGSAAVTTNWSLTGAVDTPNPGDNPIWRITEGSTYPSLVWLDHFGAQFLSYGETTFTIYPSESTVARPISPTAGFTFALAAPTPPFTVSSNGVISNAGAMSGSTHSLQVLATNTATSAVTTINLTINVSDGNLDFETTNLNATNGPTVGETVWASAYERYLTTYVLSGGGAVDEYVYRLTTAENDPTTIVDPQSDLGYTPLTEAEQTQWYIDNNYPGYTFTWRVFVCEAGGEYQNPTAQAIDYISLESVFTGTTIDADDNADMRGLVAAGVNEFRNIVGEMNAPIRGSWGYGNDNYPLYAASIYRGSCPAGFTLVGVEITDETGSQIDTKSYEIGESIHFFDSVNVVEIPAAGATIAATGFFSPYSAALMGVATIQGETSGNAPAYTGPTITRATSASPGSQVTVTGSNLSTVSRVEIDGVTINVTNPTQNSLTFQLPAGLTPGLKDLRVFSSFGTLTAQSALRVLATGEPSQNPGYWTKGQPNAQTVKLYARNPIGQGKIQFFVDGREVAWIRATAETDPKLSFAIGNSYLVRTIELKPGKNRLEIRIDGFRVWRATYTGR